MPQKMKKKAFDLIIETKDIGDDGTFSGYASVFDIVDRGADAVKKGAFVNSIKRIETRGRPLPMLWQHDSYNPIGVFDEVIEDDKGLYVEGRIFPEVTQGKNALALLKGQAVTGMSIGYKTVKYSIDENSGVRDLIEVELMEISLVTFPMLDEARVDAVKARLEDGELPSLKEFENFLREAGFSKSQATAIAGKGLAPMLRSESADDDETASIVKALAGFDLS